MIIQSIDRGVSLYKTREKNDITMYDIVEPVCQIFIFQCKGTYLINYVVMGHLV